MRQDIGCLQLYINEQNAMMVQNKRIEIHNVVDEDERPQYGSCMLPLIGSIVQ